MILYVLYSTGEFKIRYVGITTKSLKIRLNGHLKENCKSYKYRWMHSQLQKGFQIRIKKVKVFNTIEELKLGEKKLIKFLKSKNYNLVNGTDGGDGVLNPSQEIREAKRKRMSNRIVSEETKKKLSISHTGKKMPQSFIDKMKLKTSFTVDCNIPILEFDLLGTLIKRWEGIRVAARYYNISDTAIINNLRGRSKTSNKRIWKYENES